MPRTRSLGWSELRIGVVTIIAIGITVVTLVVLTGARGFFWQRYHLKARFTNVAGLNAGSPVRVAGVEVGSVRAVDFAGEQIDVTMEVNRNMRERITTASVARLGSVSLLGGSAVDITASARGTAIPDWGYVPPGRTPAQLGDITDQASQGVEEITKLVEEARNGRGTLGKLITDDRLYVELQRFVTSAGEVARGLQKGRGSIGRLLNDPKTADALERSLENLEAMTRQINSGEGSLGKLLKGEEFARSLTGATSSLETLTARLNRGEGTAGKLITDASLFNRLNSVTDRFDQLLASLNEGQGTAGQLLKDRQLYENMNGAVTDLRTLIADVRKDPKKFLNMKVSIF
jgi:phospholipid/cholesterol/gamma-HCH transport system substrate-binding protein